MTGYYYVIYTHSSSATSTGNDKGRKRMSKAAKKKSLYSSPRENADEQRHRVISNFIKDGVIDEPCNIICEINTKGRGENRPDNGLKRWFKVYLVSYLYARRGKTLKDLELKIQTSTSYVSWNQSPYAKFEAYKDLSKAKDMMVPEFVEKLAGVDNVWIIPA